MHRYQEVLRVVRRGWNGRYVGAHCVGVDAGRGLQRSMSRSRSIVSAVDDVLPEEGTQAEEDWRWLSHMVFKPRFVNMHLEIHNLQCHYRRLDVFSLHLRFHDRNKPRWLGCSGRTKSLYLGSAHPLSAARYHPPSEITTTCLSTQTETCTAGMP